MTKSDMFFLILSFSPRVASPTLHGAAATATESVNARGDTIAARLQDIPNRVREVAGHGIRRGAAVALDIAQFQTGHDLLQVEPVHLPVGSEDW